MCDELSISKCIKKFCLLLGNNIENPKYECLLLLKHILNKDTSFLYANPNYILDPVDYSKFIDCIQRRRSLEPLQYILGNQEFMGLNFKVTPDVLIPRQDTEILVESVLTNIPSHKNISILDIGTGSGCIAISIAHFTKNATVLALDISDKAIQIAYNNAITNGVLDKIFFLNSDLFSEIKNLNVDSKDFFGRNITNISNILNNKFDVIISNPPYISSSDMLTLDCTVKNFEPHLALHGGTDGLDFYRKIIHESSEFLSKTGFIAFEVGYNQSFWVASLLKKYSFEKINIIPDLSGINRVVLGHK